MKKHNRIVAILFAFMLCGCQREHVPGGPAITAEDFARQTEQATGVVLVDFWATWCAPCRMMNPIVAAAEQKFAGRLKVVRVDADANRSLAQKFQIQGIPTYVLYRDGHVMETHVGAMSADNFEHWIQTQLETP